MPSIVPAILEDNLESFNGKVAAIMKFPDLKRVQVDFSDGIFTPRKTVLPGELDILNPIIEWEAHLMVKNPRECFFDCKLAGFNTVIIHYEAIEDKNSFPALITELQGLKLSAALAINPETTVEQIDPVADLFPQILVLGVHPGYQGQQIEASAFEKIKKLRNSHKNVIIEVDGGVKISNLEQLMSAGTDLFVVGSALFTSKDVTGESERTPAQNFEQFNQLLSETKSNADTKTNQPTTSTESQ